MQRIEVYVYEDENDPNNINEIHVGDIVDKGGGKLELSILVAGEPALKLQRAFEDITSQKTLKCRTEESIEIDGEIVRVSTRIDVTPDSPQYIWAVADALEGKYGFNCRVRVR